jgi:ubiquinone/menaquinone biosynthesis C-methylase UbiE
MNGSIYDFHAAPLETMIGGPRLRTELISQARGKVLEVGAGTGFNFKYYPEGVEVTAVEPDPGMRRRAVARARLNPRIRVGDSSAEQLPFPDQSFDTVVATLTFCTIDEPSRAAKEIFRVLKPTGHFLLMEHIRKPSPIAGKVLDWLTPAWKRLSDGCHLNREPAKWIAETPFRIERYDSLWKGYGGLWVLQKP